MRHGHGRNGGSPTYAAWRGMRRRCEQPTCESYPRYGARGIKVCERWQSFENFLADMGECPDGLTLERIDGEKGYEPGNCRWDTRSEQRRNQPRNRPVKASDGRRFRTIIEAAEAVGGDRRRLRYAVITSGRSYKGLTWEWADD